jgi:hypothetical protein
MYPGWMIIGTQDPIGFPGDYTEIVNSTRAYAYADYAGLCWLQDCSECDAAAVVTPGYPYTSPITDPAPWYDENDPDSWGFLGVIGLDVEGADNSTRQATVTMGISGIGVIGPTYMGPRTLVIRALAIATDECALQYGLTWLRQQYGTEQNPCGGDSLTFFDCCPCVCPDDAPGGPCWAETYGELKGTPRCIGEAWWPLTYAEETFGPPDPMQWWPDTYSQETTPLVTVTWWPDSYEEEIFGPSSIYWPDTYGELITGPADPFEDWCIWVETYRDLRLGPPDWTCCVDACVTPYMRQYHNVRVTEGPMVLQKPQLNSQGAVAEIEFTIVAGDPVIHAMAVQAARGWVTGGTRVVETAPLIQPFVNPYRSVPPEPVVAVPALANSWVRETLPIKRLTDQVLLGVEPLVRVRAAGERSGPVRLGLWAGDQRVGGYTIPFVAERSSIIVNGPDAFYRAPGGYEQLSAFVRDWDGRWPRQVELPHGDYTLTVDQDADRPVRLLVDVSLAPVGS